jgi:carbonic anhydrase/acetyltransferase-like protein (isoleucine patch superfamily)
MSIPNTMKIGPFLPKILAKRRYLIFHFFNMWVSIIPLILEFWIYWHFLWNYDRPIHFYTFLPLLFFGLYVSLVFSAIFFAKIVLVIVNWIRSPRQGTFLRHPADKDYCYWSIRNTIKKWPFWVAHKFPFPFLDNICFKVFGIKIALGNSLFEGWVDTEFIECGKNVVVGQGAIVQSAVIIGNLLIIKKTVIEDDVRIGSHAIISPGTHIGKRAVVASNTVTIVDQELEEGYVYVGIPAKKYKKNWFFEDGLQDKLGQVKDIEELIDKYEKIYIRRYDSKPGYKERRERRKEKKEAEKERYETATEEWEEVDDGFNI